jgi:hypothetical protein
MKLITSVALALMLAAPLGLAKDKKKKDLSAVFSTARYVYVQAEDGDVMDPRLFPEDRQAIADVQDMLKDWNRYTVTLSRKDAELVMIVRKGRLAGPVLNLAAHIRAAGIRLAPTIPVAESPLKSGRAAKLDLPTTRCAFSWQERTEVWAACSGPAR